MKVVRKQEVEYHAHVREQHKRSLQRHAQHVEAVRSMNAENEQRVEAVCADLEEHHQRLLETHQQARLEAEKPLSLPSKLLARMTRTSPRSLPSEPVMPELPEHQPIPEPPPPKLLVDDPETFEVAQFLVDERLDRADPEVQDFMMVGPVRVQHGDYTLTSDRTGAVHVVAPGDLERHYFES